LGRSQGTITLLTAVIVLVLLALVNSVGYVHAASLTIDSQAGSGDCFPSPSCSVTLSTINANDIILVLAGGGGGNGLNFGTPTATGLTFNTRETLYTVILSPTADGVGEWWAVASSALSSETITLTESVTGADYAMIAYAISGANTVTPFDPDVVLPATGEYSCALCFPLASSSTVTVSTTNPNDVIFGIVGGGSDVGGGSAGTSGFTIWSVFSNPAAAEYDIVSSTQSGLAVTINFGASPGSNWSMIGDAVQAAATTTTTVNCSPTAIDVGGSSSSCTATVTGATGPISGETISWSQSGGTGSVSFPSGPTCSLSGASCSITVNGATVGNPTIQASYPRDSSNLASSGTGSLTVNSMLVAPTVTAPQTLITQGQSVTLTSSPVTTGTPPYTYQWLAKGPTDSSYSPIPGATSSSYTFTTSASTAVGVWSFELSVTDSDPSIISTPVTVTVNSFATTATTFMPVHQTPVGGVMLPSVGYTALLPWALVLSLLGVLSVEAFRVKRRAKQC